MKTKITLLCLIALTITSTSAEAGPWRKLTISHGAGGGWYKRNTHANISADPAPVGKTFDKWTGSYSDRVGDITEATTTVQMPNHHATLTATYKDIPDNVDPPDENTIPSIGMKNDFSIVAVGVFDGASRVISINNMNNKTWAKYALWSDNNRGIYFIGGEEFHGAVHANTPLYFHQNPEFFDDLTSASSSYGGSTNSCIFHKGFEFPVEEESLADVDFTSLENKSTLVLEGKTTIEMNDTEMIISNARKGWNNEVVDIINNSVIYIKDSSSGSSSTRKGDLYIKGQLDGRLTFATDRDINIMGNITYADDPQINLSSDDALGLISKRDVVVKQSCPDDIEIYAHILATGKSTSTRQDGSFGVEKYNEGNKRGYIYLHGGIAQDYRGAVGTFGGSGGTGYGKRYTYDIRFAVNPPPEYPPITDEMSPGMWRER